MTYATIMVKVEIRQTNASLLKATADLAGMFGAKVIGIAACGPMPVVYADTFVPADLSDRYREAIDKDLAAAKAEFYDALSPCTPSLDWRSTASCSSLHDYFSRNCRSADLLVTGTLPDRMVDPSRQMNPGDLVMHAGRPALLVPPGTVGLKLDRVLVAWTDARETRRAVADALPMLRLAGKVTVVEVVAAHDASAAGQRLADVVAWLASHQVQADHRISISGTDDTSALVALIDEERADVVVAGAYGHSRLHEWVLGSVTRDFMMRATRCTLVSH